MKFTSVSKLKPGMQVGQNLVGINHTEKFTTGYCLSEADIEFLSEKGIAGIYTLENPPSEILSPALMCNCISALKKTDINALLPLAEQIAAEMKTRSLCLDFKSIRSYDDYLFHHSICVAVYAVSIGIQLRMNESQLFELSLAGLLHDIGLLLSDQSVLIKKEGLSSEEYEQVKQHPQKGYELIKDNPLIPASVQEAVLHHHENINGTGYPDKQNEDNILPYARILHVVDVYDAILSKRPYKKGMSNADAINYLIGGKTILFDERIVDKFLEIAVPYPTGIEVRLSNNETGLVIGQTADNQRPLLYLENRRQIVNLSTSTAYHDITILNDVEHENDAKETISRQAITDLSSQVSGRTKKKIMIVDDVFVSIAYTKLALGEDYDIVTCLGGAKAVSMAITEKPDLILMDYEMPDLDGVSAVNEIHRLGLHMPIIFLTGKSDKETVRACGQCGAVDYILKPANPVYLQARVTMALLNIDGNTFL